MALPGSVLPFSLLRRSAVVGRGEVTSTTEQVHGVLRLEVEALVIQWTTTRETQRVGAVIRTDRDVEPVRAARIRRLDGRRAAPAERERPCACC